MTTPTRRASNGGGWVSPLVEIAPREHTIESERVAVSAPEEAVCPSCDGSGCFEVQVDLAKFIEQPCPDCQDLDEHGPDDDPSAAPTGWPGPWEGFDRNYPPSRH